MTENKNLEDMSLKELKALAESKGIELSSKDNSKNKVIEKINATLKTDTDKTADTYLCIMDCQVKESGGKVISFSRGEKVDLSILDGSVYSKKCFVRA